MEIVCKTACEIIILNTEFTQLNLIFMTFYLALLAFELIIMTLSHNWAFYLVIMTYLCERSPAVFGRVVRILLCRMLSHNSFSVCVSTYHQ